METLQKLNEWLDKPVYTEGVVLYEKHIGSGFTLTMLKAGPDEYNRQLLSEALEAKRDELAAAIQTRKDAYPDQIVSAQQQEKNLLDERTVIKERLRMKLNSGSEGDEETCAWAFDILGIRDSLDGIYGERSFFDEHGYLPEATSIDAEQSESELLTRRNTLRTYITRYTKKLKAPLLTAEQQEKYVQLLEQYRSELHQIDSELSALNQSFNVPLLD